MKWKYKLKFLLILFALSITENLNAQYCLDFKYDESGNRIEVYAHNYGFEYKVLSREMESEETSEKILKNCLSVYPNPNDGIFMVDLDDDIVNASYQILDATGIMVQEGRCPMNHNIDMNDNPAGVYLLRIIKGVSVYSCVVVKL